MIRKSLAVCVFFASLSLPGWAGIAGCAAGTVKNLTAQNKDNSNVLICTPTVAGTIQIDEYIVGNNASNAVQSFLNFTDEFRNETTSQNSHASSSWANLSSGDNFTFNTAVIRVSANNAVKFDTCIGSSNGCTGLTITGTYDVFFVVK